MVNPAPKPKKLEEPRWEDISEEVLGEIKILKASKSLRDYPIRKLVTHTKALGYYLADQNVKTNQLRKFLDAVNRIKADLRQENDVRLSEVEVELQILNEVELQILSKVEVELQILKPKLAYAVGRSDKREKTALDSFSQVISTAIDSIKNVELIKTKKDKQEFREDFDRLVYLIESVVAYHKAAGGRD